MNAKIILPLVTLLLAGTAHAASIDAPSVTRTAADALTVSWTGQGPVDVFLSDDPAAAAHQAKLISAADRDGTETVKAAPGQRSYFLLKDRRSGETVRVAERLLPLQQGSNFRDIGGYPAAGGKRVRWGLIYRSGGQPLLTDADVRQVQALKLTKIVDLRSSEERVIAPTRVDGVPYQAIGYPMAALSAGRAPGNGEGVYRRFPVFLAPQVKLVFQDLLGRKGPIAYNCSAGQDRTGFVTAIILSALGVPRETITADYHLSTTYRLPEWEMPKIDTVAQANNPVAMFFAKYQVNAAAAKPTPLKDPDGTSFLSYAFSEVEKRWGSVDAYLEQEAGVTPEDIATLRAHYLE